MRGFKKMKIEDNAIRYTVQMLSYNLTRCSDHDQRLYTKEVFCRFLASDKLIFGVMVYDSLMFDE